MIISNKAIKSCLDFAGKHLHAPEQRLILGATALATQPFIDLRNKEVDEKTRMTSVARTIAKIVAGTVVGVIVRQAGISLIKRYTKYKPIVDKNNYVIAIARQKGRDLFVPLFIGITKTSKITAADLDKKFQLYTKALGTFVATVAMMFTNFLIDAPLTKYLTSVFTKKINKEVPKKDIDKTGEDKK